MTSIASVIDMQGRRARHMAYRQAKLDARVERMKQDLDENRMILRIWITCAVALTVVLSVLFIGAFWHNTLAGNNTRQQVRYNMQQLQACEAAAARYHVHADCANDQVFGTGG